MKKINLFNRNIDLPSYRRTPVSRGFNRGGGIPLFSGMTAVIFALFVATPSFATPTELDKKTVASKAYVDTKQDIIETGLVEFEGDDATINVPSVVTTNAAGTGVSGNQIGFMTLSAFAPTASPFLDFKYRDDGDSFVPSAALVAMGLEDMYNTLTDMLDNFTSSYLAWNSLKHTAAINAYNTTFGNGTNQWAGSSEDLINGQFLANSLALKQNKIPAGTAGNVVTYSGTAGTVGSVATANAPTYNETTGVLENGTNIATIAAVDTRQKKMTCAGWDSETHTDEHCWLWSIE